MQAQSLIQRCLLGALLLCAAACVLFSLRWPLVGDASLMHYVVFLMGKGWAPYRDIVDVNLPGSYASEAIAMKLFGWGALGWRFYDLTLIFLLTIAAIAIAGKRNQSAGLMTGTLFLVIHLQDGLAQAGQRDLLIAVLLLWSYVWLFIAQKDPRRRLPILLFGLFIGATVTIKPLLLPLGILLALMSAWRRRQAGLDATIDLALGALGLLLPSACALLWVRSRGGLPAFLNVLETLIPYHASLGHRPALFLLTHSVSPLLPLVVLWIILVVWRRRRLTLERSELILGAAMAFLAYVIQGKGYPYQRYPLLGMLLVLISVEISESLRESGPVRLLGTLALLYAGLVVAPFAAWKVRSFRPDRPFEQALTADLQKIGGPLEKNVQCLDTFGGCINTLYDMRIVQSTGFVYDCYLFTPGRDPAAELYRKQFWTAYQAAKPRILVMTNQYCFDGYTFQKLDNWPLFRDEIARSYDQAVSWRSERPQRWWSRLEQPPEYKIYLRK